LAVAAALVGLLSHAGGGTLLATGLAAPIIQLAEGKGRDWNPLDFVSRELGTSQRAVLDTVAATPHLTVRQTDDGFQVLNASSAAAAAGFTLSVQGGQPALAIEGPGGILLIDGRQVETLSHFGPTPQFVAGSGSGGRCGRRHRAKWVRKMPSCIVWDSRPHRGSLPQNYRGRQIAVGSPIWSG
jgi:hypothetical protein